MNSKLVSNRSVIRFLQLGKRLAISCGALLITQMAIRSSAVQICDTNWGWRAIGVPPGWGENSGLGSPVADISGVLYFLGTDNSQDAAAVMACIPPDIITGGDPTFVTLASGFSIAQEGVAAMAVKGNTLYIAGSFQGFTDGSGNPVAATNVASFNGTTWSPIGNGTPTNVTAMAVDSNGRVYVGMTGRAPVVSGNLIGMVATFDVPSQQWLAVGGGLAVDQGYNGDGCYAGTANLPLASHRRYVFLIH